jgi:hypothetical protein
MMDTKGNPDFKTMQVVFCLFGGDGGAAFLALLPTPDVFRIGEIDYNAVLIPSAPVPVSNLLFVPTTSVRPAGCRSTPSQHLRPMAHRPAIVPTGGCRIDIASEPARFQVVNNRYACQVLLATFAPVLRGGPICQNGRQSLCDQRCSPTRR